MKSSASGSELAPSAALIDIAHAAERLGVTTRFMRSAADPRWRHPNVGDVTAMVSNDSTTWVGVAIAGRRWLFRPQRGNPIEIGGAAPLLARLERDPEHPTGLGDVA